MKGDSRLSDSLHLVLHLAGRNGPTTSEALATSLRSHPVVVRRIMAGLRERGFVESRKGHGGGWELSCDLSAVTVRDVYLALGSPTLLALTNRQDHPTCLVEQAVNEALDDAYVEAERVILSRLGEVTLAELRDSVEDRLTRRETMAACGEG